MKAPTYGKRGGLKAFDRGSRKVSHAFGKETVLTHDPKADGGIALEGESERMFSHMCGLDPTVAWYSAQPFAVELTMGVIAGSDEDKVLLRARAQRHGCKAVFYTPDFRLGWASGVQAAVETKFAKFLGDAEYQQKLKIVASILQQHGIEFMQVVMPSDWRHPLRTTLPLLHQAAMRLDLWPGPEVGDAIEALHAAGARTMGDYLAGLALDSRMSPLLLVSGHLEADLVDQPLCFATPASPAFGNLSHLQLVKRFAK